MEVFGGTRTDLFKKKFIQNWFADLKPHDWLLHYDTWQIILLSDISINSFSNNNWKEIENFHWQLLSSSLKMLKENK